MPKPQWKYCLAILVLAIVGAGPLIGCDNDASGGNRGRNNDSNPLSELSPEQIHNADGTLTAIIRYTTGGVPHITAVNLESAAFGSGYAQAQANACVIADQILRVRGERALYYGPGPSINGDLPAIVSGVNVVSDFSIKALGLLDRAQAEFGTLSPATRAILRGFVAGYNRYLRATDNLTNTGRHHKCAGASWVKPITAQELYACFHLVARYASGMQFATGATYFAGPGPLTATLPSKAGAPAAAGTGRQPLKLVTADLPIRADFRNLGAGSNGWGLGSALTESGRGALLANPHFPYTGSHRLFQMHITVPGAYNVNGAALLGVPLPLIGFNQSVAWTHTVSTANHFTFYTLKLAAGNDLVYLKDGERHLITEKTLRIQVNTGGPHPVTLKKTFYYSEYGPMINAHLINSRLPKWGEAFAGKPVVAFTYRDANSDTAWQVLDQWLQMGMADNLTEFKQAFQGCSSVLWVNTLYADADGKAFYIDANSVPKLSRAALRAYRERMSSNRLIAALAAKGVILLDGSTSRDDWVEGRCGTGLIHYGGMPKLTRRDYVQNANDSYWATNLDHLLSGYSPLYGPTGTATGGLSPRTRMSLKMITQPTDAGLSKVKPAGADGKFSGKDIITMLYSNRAYYAELLLDDLIARCDAIGRTPVTLGNGASRPVTEGCTALNKWDGVYNTDSRGAQVFRVFIGHYDNLLPDAFTVKFNPARSATTPRQPPDPADNLAQDPMLMALAQGLEALDSVRIDYNAKLGAVQCQQQSAAVPPRTIPQPAGPCIPWPGTQNIEGGFNIVEPYIGAVARGTRYPRLSPPSTLPDTGNLSSIPGQGWRIGRGTSWHFGLMFTDQGPQAWGLISYSQSADSGSPHFSDQDRRYSQKSYRELLYSTQEIRSDPNWKEITVTAPDRSPVPPQRKAATPQ